VNRYSCSNRAEANERMGIIKDLGASTQPSSMRDKAYMTMFHLVYNQYILCGVEGGNVFEKRSLTLFPTALGQLAQHFFKAKILQNLLSIKN
jgi:hypothetical protein